jgi:hypothetical protein
MPFLLLHQAARPASPLHSTDVRKNDPGGRVS